jgi:ketosteroid isomerase-like protein
MVAMQGAIRSTVRSAMVAAAMLAPLASCGGKAAGPPRPAAASEGRAREDAKAVVDEVYRALKSSDTDDLLSLMSEAVLVVGPRPTDLLRSRAEVVTALEEVIDSRKKTRFSSAGAKLVIGPGGRSAYAVDRLKLGAHAVVAIALLDGQGAIWRVNAAALATPIAAAAARKAAAAGALSAPAATAQPALPEGEAARKALAAGLAQPATWLGALADDADAAIATADGGVATGKRNLERAARRFADVALVATSSIASVTSGDGQLAMVTCLATKQWKTEAARPVRLTAIFRRVSENAKPDLADSWQLAVFQESHAVAAK